MKTNTIRVHVYDMNKNDIMWKYKEVLASLSALIMRRFDSNFVRSYFTEEEAKLGSLVACIHTTLLSTIYSLAFCVN